MRPRKAERSGSSDLFRMRLGQIIDTRHELARIANSIDWNRCDGELADRFSNTGRPGTETRFMVGLLLLKHIYTLSNKGVSERWMYDP